MRQGEESVVQTGETEIFVSRLGSGPPLLLVHGFPQTHRMWRRIASELADEFEVVATDLRGYGASGCPPSDPDHAPYSKRAMARDMVSVMESLGHRRFAVAGHDRGGRVAYRMALDHPERVERLAVLDVLPTSTVWDRANAEFALGYWPWAMLAQPEPLPERFLEALAEDVVEAALGGWGTPSSVYSEDDRNAYIEALRRPEHAHAICEEYRAAVGIDRLHDAEDQTAGRRIVCPMLILWSFPGPLGQWYVEEGGPLGLWKAWAEDVRGVGFEAGHFFPEEAPGPTVEALRGFFSGAR